ncbi:MAG: hypothetical protein RJB38_1964 [Pseudomonadota bacterium]
MSAIKDEAWVAYSVLVLLALGAALAPLFLRATVRLFQSSRKRADEVTPTALKKESAQASILPATSSVNTRYFTAAQLGGVLTIPLVLLIPLVTLSDGDDFASLLSLVVICLSMGCALTYLNRKGDLRLLQSLQAEPQPQESRKETQA